MISGPRPSNLADRIQELDLNREDRMTRAQRMIGPVAAALLLAVTAVTTQAQPQFAGTWTLEPAQSQFPAREGGQDRKSTRLNSSHSQISYAVFCLKKKKTN